MYLVCIRHGQSWGNLADSPSTQIHDRLTPLGQEQAQLLARYLADYSIDRAYSSPLVRAMQTAQPWAQSVQQKVEVWPELAEGFWQARTNNYVSPVWRSEPMSHAPEIEEQLFTFGTNGHVCPVQDETWEEAAARRDMVLQRIMDRHKGSNDSIVLFSHGWMLSQLMEKCIGIDGANRMDLANTGISVLVHDKRGWRVRYINRLPQQGSALLGW